jgi:hypothetical protein
MAPSTGPQNADLPLMACAINRAASLTRMQLVGTLASWRPDLTAYRDLDSAYRVGLKSLARRYLES